ncbi:hypothetical protein HMPREF1391_01682 [Helicobacter pylori GAM100Ai]|uniref:Uncharacterized protein n=1 Tax=Helicobacter pylori GAM100Ai TaxID=1159019 RepID=A0AB72ZT24_HELPX|nr:hypothetical protein HMPREF1391_01682 [Helicobacter pylori GAM100Ai]
MFCLFTNYKIKVNDYNILGFFQRIFKQIQKDKKELLPPFK